MLMGQKQTQRQVYEFRWFIKEVIPGSTSEKKVAVKQDSEWSEQKMCFLRLSL